MQHLIPRPKPRSSRWVSSSVPQYQWNTLLAMHASAEYHINNLLNAVQHIPHNAITIEIAPHGLLQPILECSLNKGITHIAITQQGHPECTWWLLTALGKLYELGLQPQLANLYPPVKYPVSRGTPMISPLVQWEHSEDWYVMRFTAEPSVKSGEQSVIISLEDESVKYLSGYIINGINLFPATGYLELVWKSVSLMTGKIHTNVPVVFEDVWFHRTTDIPKEGSIQFTVMVQKASGRFEVTEGNALLASGLVRVPANMSYEMVLLEPSIPHINDELLELSSQDIYKELRLRGYDYQGLFRGLVSADNHGQTGKISSKDNWVAFLDNLLQMKILQEESRGLLVPTCIQKITIDEADVHELNTKSHDVVLSVHVYKELDIIQSAGVEVRGLQTNAITQYKCPTKPVLENYVFTPNVEPGQCTEGLHTHSSGEHECHPCEGGGAAQSRHHTSVTSCESHHCGHATYKSKCNNV